MASGLGSSLRSLGKSCAASSCIFFSMLARSSGVNGCFAQKFVEEAVVDRRPDPQFHVGEKFDDRGGQQVRRGMTEDVERVGVFVGEDLELDVVFERTAQIDEFAVG